MRNSNVIGLTTAYQYRSSQRENEKQSFLKNIKVKNKKETFRRYLDSDSDLSHTGYTSGGKYVLLGTVVFIASLTGGALIYGSRNKSISLGNPLSQKKVSFDIGHHKAKKINNMTPSGYMPYSNGKKRREINTTRNSVTLSPYSGNHSQIKDCEISHGEFKYKIINKPLVRQDYNNLTPQNLREVLSSLQERCDENIKFINVILADSTHLLWRKLDLIFPFMPPGSKTELLENCRTQLLVSKEKISSHDIQLVKCSNDGSLGAYMAGMLRKNIYQLGVDTLVYTNDFSSLTDHHSATSTILHEIKHATSGMADSLYFPYPATFLSQIESLAETIKNIFSDKIQFLKLFSDPMYDIYSNATTTDKVTTNSFEIKFYVKKTYPRDVAMRETQLSAENKTMSQEDYAKILQTRIFSHSGTINNNEALLFIGSTSINDIFYGLLEYVRHILHQNQNSTTVEYSTENPGFIDEFRRP